MFFVVVLLSDPRTLFYLVCGGELVHGREKQCREQMNLIYNLIVEKGMAPAKNIMFVYGRGHKLNKKVKSFECTGPMFRLYGPSNQQQGFAFNPQPAGPKCPLPGPQDNGVHCLGCGLICADWFRSSLCWRY